MNKILSIILAVVCVLMPMNLWAQDVADETVYDPSFDFEGNNLVINCYTEGATIYYALEEFSTEDEANSIAESLVVNERSTLYTAPIPITSNVVVKAIAVRQGMQNSNVSVLIYNFTVWEELLKAIEYGTNVLERAQDYPDIEGNLKEQLQWMLEESQYFYRERGMMENSQEAEMFTQRIMEIASEIENIIGPAQSSPEPYAVLSNNNTVLTFYYDENKDRMNGMSVGPFDNNLTMGWSENLENIQRVVFDSSFADCTSLTSTAYWFDNMINLTEIEGLEHLNVQNVTTMRMMFNGCRYLKSLDLSNFVTANVTDMTWMFQDCTELVIIFASQGWSTAQVSASNGMFNRCTSLVGGAGTHYDADHTDHTYAHIDGGTANPGYLTDILLGPWVEPEPYAVLSENNTVLTFYYDDQKTARNGMDVADPSSWESNASTITTVVFDTSFAEFRPTSTRAWFQDFYSLTNINGISNLKTDSVTNMAWMFSACTSLTNLDVSGFNTANVTDMNNMFQVCYGLTSLDLSSFNTGKVTNMKEMFFRNSNLTTIYVSNEWDTTNVTESGNMFDRCTSLIGGAGTHYDANHTDYTYAHIDGGTANPGYLTDIKLGPWVEPEPYAVLSDSNTVLTFYYDGNRDAYKESMNVTRSSWADYASTITSVIFDASFANYTSLTSTQQWFSDCINLATITGINNLKTDSVTDMSEMFSGCKSLTSLNVSYFNTANVTRIRSMFSDCSGLTSLDLSNFNTTKVTDISEMFRGCSSLKTLDLSGFNTANVTVMSSMFSGCSALITIYVDSVWSTASATSQYASYMFSDCTNLVGGAGTRYDANHTDYTYAHIDGGTENPGYFTNVVEKYRAPLMDEARMLLSELEDIYQQLEDSEDFTYNNARLLKEAVIQKATELKNLGDAQLEAEMQAIIDAVNEALENSYSKDEITNRVNDARRYVEDFWYRLQEATTIEALDALKIEAFELESLTDAVMKDSETWIQEYNNNENAFNTKNASSYYESMWNHAHRLNYQLFKDGDLFVAKGLIFKVLDTEKKTCQLGRGEGNWWPDDLWAAKKLRNSECYEYIKGDYPPGNSGNYLDQQKMTLPDQVLGYTLTIVGEAAFNQKSMNLFALNESLEEIGKDAFTTYGLKEIFIPKKVKKIGIFAFSRYCANMQRFEVDEENPYLNHTDDYKGVVETATNTLVAACEDLEIPEYITALGDGIFYDCKFTAKVLPDNLQKIGTNVFQYCSNLTSIELPETLKEIGNYAFWESGLQQISLPDSIMSIGKQVFMNCAKLDTIRAYWLQPFQISEDVFTSKHYEQSILYVPYGTKAKYQTTESWSKFQNIVEMEKTWTEPEPYAILSNNNTILTFYFDENKQLLNGMNVGPFDVSNPGWYEQRESITHVVFDDSFADCTTLTSTAYWFYQCKNLSTITDIKNLNTDNVTDMDGMFQDCSSLTSLDVTGFNTDNVTTMNSMFYRCSGLTSLDVSHFNTSKVTDMSFMFYRCSGLTSLDVSGFNTSNVQTMGYTFAYCYGLKSLDVSKFNTSNVTSMAGLFSGCSGLKHLDVKGLNTSKARSMHGMFQDCSGLISVDLSNFNTANTVSMIDMFSDCSSLASIQAGSAYIPAEEYAQIGNPNLLVYVNNASLAPEGIQNIVINGLAQEIVLTDAKTGNNNFYCPQSFTADHITYTRDFQQQTEVDVSRGWEGIALPFTVQTITHEKNGALAPFANGSSDMMPFWLRYYDGAVMMSAPKLEAYTPYVISMPNSEFYPDEYNQAGKVTFEATNIVVDVTPDFSIMEQEQNRPIVVIPVFQTKAQSDQVYAINVGEPRGDYAEGSVFERNLREVRPFEVYTVHNSQGARPLYIPISAQTDNEGTGIVSVLNSQSSNENWYDLNGRKLTGEPKTKGVYIYKGKKVIR